MQRGILSKRLGLPESLKIDFYEKSNFNVTTQLVKKFVIAYFLIYFIPSWWKRKNKS
jgi:hypothetical protein